MDAQVLGWSYEGATLSAWRTPIMKFVIMYVFKLEGGELFKEGFRNPLQ